VKISATTIFRSSKPTKAFVHDSESGDIMVTTEGFSSMPEGTVLINLQGNIFGFDDTDAGRVWYNRDQRVGPWYPNVRARFLTPGETVTLTQQEN